MTIRRRVAVTLALAAILGAWACSSSIPILTPQDSGNADSGGGDVVFVVDGTADAPDTSCPSHCSSDLHQVFDCNDKLVATCPDDQGCGGSACVPACDAAKANNSNVGCDYFVVEPDTLDLVNGACFAAYVVNTWSSPVSLTGDWNGKPLAIANASRLPSGSGQALSLTPLTNGQLQPGEVAIVFLNSFGGGGLLGIDCPTQAALTDSDGAVHGTALGHAFHLASDRPVVAYDVMPYGGGAGLTTSATLLVPTTAWDTNYVAVNAFRQSQVGGQNFIAIAAQEDNTAVTISPTATIYQGAGVPGTSKGVPITYNLMRGEYVQITQDGELTGSPIQANKPIGVWGGATCFNIDTAFDYCDTGQQQLFPVSALGWEYVGVRYRNRYDGIEETVPWRIVGAVDGTTLTYEPSTPAGAPTIVDNRDVKEFWTSDPFVVRSQDNLHPFYVSGHMTGAHDPHAGGSTDGGPNDRGDPEYVNVVTPAQFLTSYVFFTDPTYPETDLVIVRTKGSSGFADVTLDCAGVVTGWQPVGTSGTYEYTRVDLVTGDFAPVGNCDNGRHEIHSTVPFGVTIWGWGTEAVDVNNLQTLDVSYAYPAGAYMTHITPVVVPPIPK
jgi:hypothetical protein